MIGRNAVLIGTLIILALCLAPAASGSAMEGFNGTVIHVPGNYSSIQAAIDAASDGDRIVVENGTYNEHLNVTASVAIVGVGMPVVNATWTGTAITVTADGVHLSGIAATGGSGPVLQGTIPAGIQILGDDALIENCSSNQNDGIGILVRGADGVAVEHTACLKNSECGYYALSALSPSLIESTITGGDYYGVAIRNCSDAIVRDNEVSDTNLGVYFNSCSGGTIAANTVHDSEDDGIEVGGTRDAVLDGNIVSDNGGDGISLASVVNLTMQSNVMTGNARNFGYRGDDPAPGNIIDTSNTVDGRPVVYLEGMSGMTIDSSSNAGVVCCVGCDNMTVKGLTLQDNGFDVGFFSTRDSSIEGCTIADAYNCILLNNVSGIDIGNCSITASGMDQWLLDIDGAADCNITGNTLTGYGNSGMELGSLSETEISGNTVRFTASGDESAIVDIDTLTNSTVTENLLDFSDANVTVGGFRDNGIYLNDITLQAQYEGHAVEQVCSSSVPSTGNVWHSPDPIVYRYDDCLCQNYTGNHWNPYTGVDANDDGIGDSPYVIESEDQDDYPLMTSFAAYAAPLTIYVPQDVPTIGEALGLAQDGDSIVVSAGTYNESVWIDKCVSITGIGMPVVRSVYIDGGGAVFDGFRVSGDPDYDVGIDIEATDAVVKNNVATGNRIGIGIAHAGNVTLENNTMTNNTYNFAYASDNPAPHNTIDLSNTVDGRPVVYLEDVSGAAIPADAGAVVCVNCSDMTIADLSLDHSYSGVALIGSSGVTAEDCTIADSNYGVSIINSSDCTIAGTAFKTDRRGVYAAEGSRDLKILNSSFVSDYYGAAFSYSDAVIISGNSFGDCGYGLAMRAGSNCTVENNAIEGCSRAGLVLRNYDSATVTMNTVNSSSCGAEISDVLNSSVSKNTFSGSDASVFADDLQGTCIYLNNFLGAFSGLAASEAAVMSTAAPSAGEVRDSENLAADVFSFTGETAAAPLDTISAASSEGIWHSPVEEDYWYRGIGHTNYTGNYWSTYNGTDANGDGIGDTPFVFAGKDLDLYPLMDRFEAYATTAPDSGDSSSDGTVGASGDLKAGATASMHFDGSAVTTINVTAGQRIDGIMLTVAPASSGPAGLDAPVYQYLVVNLTYTTDDAISEADFTFSVPKSWLTAQGLAPGEIALWRYHNGTWTALPTEIISEDGDHVVYRAVSPGFSCFAVAGGATVTPAPTTTPIETIQTPQTNTTAPAAVATAEPRTTTETLPPTTQQSPLGLAPLLALGVSLLLVRRR